MKILETHILEEANYISKGVSLKGFQKGDPRSIIIHYTACSYETAIRFLADPKTKVSAHLIISKSGEITQIVPFNKIAHHAGKSSWRTNNYNLKDFNKISIGIELENWGLLKRKDHKFYCWPPLDKHGKPLYRKLFEGEVVLLNENFWDQYTEIQMEILKKICLELLAKYPIHIDLILGHCDIAPKRKIDPGDAFDLQKFIKSLALQNEEETYAYEEMLMKDLKRKRDC